MKKNLYFIIVVMGLLFVMVVLLSKSRSHQLLTDATIARKNGEPIPVSIFSVNKDDISTLTAFECVTKANPQISISSPINNAIVREASVALGDSVKKGQLLVKLDDRAIKAQVENESKEVRYLADTAIEKKSLTEYYQVNLSKGFVKEDAYRKAKIDWTMSQNDYQRAQKALAEALVELDKTKIIAPRDGVVTEIINVGQVAAGSDNLVSIAGIDPILAVCSLPDTDYALLGDKKVGESVKFAFPALAGKAYEGIIKRVYPSANYEQRMVPIGVEIANPDHALLPGMAATGQIIKNKNAVRIPAVSLISTHNNEGAVFVIEKDVARLRSIRTGVSSSGYVEVVSGLSVNDKVVVAGQVDLQEGDLVKIIEPSEDGPNVSEQ